MKKFTRKIMLSLVAVLFCVIAMGTSTYAWFAMNDKVTASSMLVKAEASSPFIQIKSSTDTEYDTTTTTLKQLDGSKVLKLVAVTGVTGTTVSWGTASSTDPTEVQETSKVSAVEAGNLDKYVLSDTITIKNASAEVDAKDLSISKVTMTKENAEDTLAPATRVLFVWADGYAMFNFAGTLIYGNSLIAGTFTKNTELVISVYMFFDGTDSTAFTSGAKNLGNVQASFLFTIDGADGHVKGTAAASGLYTPPTVE